MYAIAVLNRYGSRIATEIAVDGTASCCVLRVLAEAALEDVQLDTNCDVFSDCDIIDEVSGWIGYLLIRCWIFITCTCYCLKCSTGRD